jgi:ribosomal protein L40E
MVQSARFGETPTMRNWFFWVKRDPPPPNAPRCEKCSATALKRKVATYPVHLTGKLTGKRLDIYRVELDKCRKCGHLMPTPEGLAKIKRCTKTGIKFFRNQMR